MNVDNIIQNWRKKKMAPVYLLEGEEGFFIDQLVQYADQEILTEQEASFNKTIFYGKDADWTSVINACRRYPMFAEKQLVMIREAQMMTSLDKLEAYVESPLPSTIFIIAYKGKTLDKRTRLYKLILKNGEIHEFPKIPEYKMHDWIAGFVASKGFEISSRSVSLLMENIGNDPGRIATEIEKLAINLKERKKIGEDDIETYIGISKEYNIFELQSAIAGKNLAQAIKIINYFENNPKAAPIPMALPALYSFVSKVYASFGLPGRSESDLKPLFYNNISAARQARQMIENYGYAGVEKMVLLMNLYNLKSIGVGDAGTSDASLLKEMVSKFIVA